MNEGRKKMNKTEKSEKIISILKENTGRHILDSGGAYGRQWERNQDRDFYNEPPQSVEVDADENGKIDSLNVYFNIFHFLNTYLEYDTESKKLTKQFLKFSDTDRYYKESWEICIGDFCKSKKIEVSGSTYTYNFETILSQNIIYYSFEWKDGDYIFLQVHNGCDARGGFTAPVIFNVPDKDYFHIAMNDISAFCTGRSEELTSDKDLFDLPSIPCGNNWRSDDGGYHWWYDGCSDDKKPFFDTVVYNEEDEKIYCKECGAPVEIYVMESY